MPTIASHRARSNIAVPQQIQLVDSPGCCCCLFFPLLLLPPVRLLSTLLCTCPGGRLPFGVEYTAAVKSNYFPRQPRDTRSVPAPFWTRSLCLLLLPAFFCGISVRGGGGSSEGGTSPQWPRSCTQQERLLDSIENRPSSSSAFRWGSLFPGCGALGGGGQHRASGESKREGRLISPQACAGRGRGSASLCRCVCSFGRGED